MRTLGVVHAYVGVFPSLLSLPPRLRDSYRMRRLALRAQTTYIIQQHTGRCHGRCGGVFADTNVSLSCFTDLVRCEPLRSGGTLWSTGRAALGEIPFAAEDRDSYPSARLGPL
ncbi:hypothetical protein B0H14DRAFT_2853889, partial [Mycena olivaceomarginata]